MRKHWKAFLGIVLLFSMMVATSMGTAEEQAPWVTMENLAEQGSVVWWNEDTASQANAAADGFEPVKKDPSKALIELKQAYDKNGDEGVHEVLAAWGIQAFPSGRPALRELDIGEDIPVGWGEKKFYSVAAIGFQGWGWGDEGTLVFVEGADGWYLWDYLDAECKETRIAGDGFFLEFSEIGHGTGHYSVIYNVYNLFSRRIEAGYVMDGYEVYQDRGIGVTGAAAYKQNQVHIFKKLSLLLYDQEVNDFVPSGSVLQEIVYTVNDQGSLEKGE